MLRFVVRRLLLLVPILLGLSILVFVWIRALPGSPAQALLGERATPAADRADQATSTGSTSRSTCSTGTTSSRPSHGDLGDEHHDAAGRSPTRSAQRFPATVELALAAMIFAIVLGIPLGFFAAKRYGQRRSTTRASSSR